MIICQITLSVSALHVTLKSMCLSAFVCVCACKNGMEWLTITSSCKMGSFFLRKRKQLKQKERMWVWCSVCVSDRQKQTLKMKKINITE